VLKIAGLPPRRPHLPMTARFSERMFMQACKFSYLVVAIDGPHSAPQGRRA
jgi:hypothetical protein